MTKVIPYAFCQKWIIGEESISTRLNYPANFLRLIDSKDVNQTSMLVGAVNYSRGGILQSNVQRLVR